mmetsp:Transcript_6259/g.13560  ORF Transcript_6259/g.13560 Transcript_6259/m.13560 type:complete len:326 (-) Transcript_6259:121-1098(-)
MFSFNEDAQHSPSWVHTDPAGTNSDSANDTNDPDWVKGDVEQISSPPNSGPIEAKSININTSQSNAAIAAQKTWSQYFTETFKRDGRLLLIAISILVVMNLPLVRWILYPFLIFSTWIHEMCHAIAGLMSGGSVQNLKIYPDGSGLAYVSTSNLAFVYSAGYQGTAVVGCLLLILRRTKSGPRSGTMALAVAIVLTCLIWVRSFFGFFFLFGLGIALGAAAWKLPSTHIRNLYIILAVTCTLNSITSIQVLFGENQVVNGQPSSTDAHMMAVIQGGNHAMWALLWLVFALFLCSNWNLACYSGTGSGRRFRYLRSMSGYGFVSFM